MIRFPRFPTMKTNWRLRRIACGCVAVVAVNLFALHEQLSEEDVHASLERLQSLLAKGQLLAQEETP